MMAGPAQAERVAMALRAILAEPQYRQLRRCMLRPKFVADRGGPRPNIVVLAIQQHRQQIERIIGWAVLYNAPSKMLFLQREV